MDRETQKHNINKREEKNCRKKRNSISRRRARSRFFFSGEQWALFIFFGRIEINFGKAPAKGKDQRASERQRINAVKGTNTLTRQQAREKGLDSFHFFPKFCEPPNFRIESISDSCEVVELALTRASRSVDGARLLVVLTAESGSPSCPIRRTVRCSVMVLPKGFGATVGGDGDACWETGETRVIICLRSLSTVTWNERESWLALVVISAALTVIWVVRSVTSSCKYKNKMLVSSSPAFSHCRPEWDLGARLKSSLPSIRSCCLLIFVLLG